MKRRLEHDSLGQVAVDARRLYGAQTQRSVEHFWAGGERIPPEIIEALLMIKSCAVSVNNELKLLDPKRAKAILEACEAQLTERNELDYPLVIWQTGSGTQTNMNVNEVVARVASEQLKKKKRSAIDVHPHDEVNRGQSSNDVFPTAIHVAVYLEVKRRLEPALDRMLGEFARLSKRYRETIKVGRTHLMDAVPLTYGDVFGSFHAQLEWGKTQLTQALGGVEALALGATAVGTGLNTHPKFAKMTIDRLNKRLKSHFRQADNLFCALSSHEPMVSLSASLRTLATSLHKIASDIRWLASGPRCGLGELALPENEPGSSIMPGKVNPTQCESLTQIAIQVIALDSAIAMANALGQFELNVYKPLIAHNALRSIRLLSDGMEQFASYALQGLCVNEKRTDELVHQSLMLATILSEKIGYDKTSQIVRKAHLEGKTLKQTSLELGFLSASEYEAWVQPHLLLGSAHRVKKTATKKKKD